MASAPFFLDEDDQLSPAEMRYEWACGALDQALSADTDHGRYAGLLSAFLICEPQDREAVFLETAQRLSRCEEAITRPTASRPSERASAPTARPAPAGSPAPAPSRNDPFAMPLRALLARLRPWPQGGR